MNAWPERIEPCVTAARKLQMALGRRPIDDAFAFRVPIAVGWQLSVSVPPDANVDNPPTYVETALIGRKGRIVYNDRLGYNDVRGFCADAPEPVWSCNYVDMITSEINRLQKALCETQVGKGERQLLRRMMNLPLV